MPQLVRQVGRGQEVAPAQLGRVHARARAPGSPRCGPSRTRSRGGPRRDRARSASWWSPRRGTRRRGSPRDAGPADAPPCCRAARCPRSCRRPGPPRCDRARPAWSRPAAPRSRCRAPGARAWAEPIMCSRRSSVHFTGRRASDGRGGDQQVLRVAVGLGAEAAAHVGGDDADLVRRQPERGHQALLHEVDDLGAVPRGERAVPRIPLGDHAARLDRHAHVARDHEALAHPRVGLAEGRLDVAEARS